MAQGNLKAEVLILQNELKLLNDEVNNKIGELSGLPLDELVAQNAYWTTNNAVIEQALLDARNRQRDKSNRLGQMENNLADLARRSEKLELEITTLNETVQVSSVEEIQIAGKIEVLTKTVTPMEDQLALLEKEHNSLLSTDTEARQVLRSAEQQYTLAKIAYAHHQELFETLRGHIEDDFGLVSFDYTDWSQDRSHFLWTEWLKNCPRLRCYHRNLRKLSDNRKHKSAGWVRSTLKLKMNTRK